MARTGRPTKYKPEYCQKMIKYFDVEPTKITIETFYYKNGDEKVKEIEVANELPLIQDFCRSIDISKDTLHRWRKKYKEFSYAYKVSKELQEAMYIKNSLKGLYNPTFSIFAGKNMFGWRDRREVGHDGGEDNKGNKLPINIVKASDEDIDKYLNSKLNEDSQ